MRRLVVVFVIWRVGSLHLVLLEVYFLFEVHVCRKESLTLLSCNCDHNIPHCQTERQKEKQKKREINVVREGRSVFSVVPDMIRATLKLGSRSVLSRGT